jgi:Ca-activated chloride channel homolog
MGGTIQDFRTENDTKPMKRAIIAGIFVTMFGCAFIAEAQQSPKLIRRGNRNYEAGKYKEAEIDYRKSIASDPASVKGSYNLGNALYKQNNFAESASAYQALSDSKIDKKDKAKVFHNLGNSLFENKKYEESIDAYKQSLLLNPKDDDTRYNLAYAMSKLKQQQQNKNQQKNDKKQQEKQQQKQQKQQQKEQDKQQHQQQNKQMSKQDANRMLEALKNNEKKTMDKLKKEKAKATKVQVEKDW